MLHILNGDSTAQSFLESGINQPFIVWREALMDGPVVDLPFDEFFKLRSQYLEDGSESATYEKMVVKELQKVGASDETEITLWFEHDLFCQVNLAFLIFYLQSTFPEKKLYLICTDTIPGVHRFKGYGELNPKQIGDLVKITSKLSDQELEFYQNLWKKYVSGNPAGLWKFLEENTTANPITLKALRLHLKRLPGIFNGLNIIQESIIDNLLQRPKKKNELITEMLAADLEFGFGDTQLYNYLKELNPLIEENREILSVTELGGDVLEGKEDYIDHMTRPHWTGSVEIKPKHENWRIDFEGKPVLL